MKRMMKKHHSWNSMLKACAMLFVSVFCLASCYNDDDIKNDISDLRSRVTSLEEWQKSVNSDIQSIQTILEALQKQNYITAVTPFSGGG